MDYAPGGTRSLPDGIAGEAPIAWDRAVELTEAATGAVARLLDTSGDARETERVRSARATREWDMIEASCWLPGGFKEAVTRSAGMPAAGFDAAAPQAAADESTPINFYVFTTDGGLVLDSITAGNSPSSNTHNVAFVQHLNQGLTYTTVFRGERGENAVNDGDPNNPDDGADELLAAHDYYNLPVNWHQAGTLISAAEWHDKGFNDWLTGGVTAGRYEMITSAYGQHMMPFLRDEINGKAVHLENSMISYRYGFTPRVAWVPERVWCENPDNDGNGVTASGNVIDWIGDDFADNGIWAVILDDYIHCGYNNNAFNDHHIYTYGGIKVLPIDNNFVGDVNWNWGNAWNRILSSTSDEIIIYGNDAEIAAEVSQGAGNPDALNNYIHILQQCSAFSGTVSVWKLTDVLQDPGFTTQALTLQSGTYGLLGGLDGYGGGNNYWYGDWAAYTGAANLDGHVPKWNYGQQWNNVLNKLLTAPANNLSEMAWYILVTNLHETGWHDNGEISGWQNHYSNHIRSANPHTEAARWAGGLYVNPTGAYLSDIDDDGVEELVMYNDRLLAVFDTIGGKLQWLFCKGADYNYSVVSNDNAYWVDTDGDYNETNHVATLSDVSVGGSDKEHELYGLSVVAGSGNTVTVKLTHPAVTKTVSLTLGQPYLDVVYKAPGQRVYVKNGFSPDLRDMTWNGTLNRVWDPDGGGYFGQKNPNTNATAGIVVGSAGGHHNTQFSATLLEGDEFYGDSQFEVYVYGGFSSALDGQGHIPELKALRDALTDHLGPLALKRHLLPGHQSPHPHLRRGGAGVPGGEDRHRHRRRQRRHRRRDAHRLGDAHHDRQQHEARLRPDPDHGRGHRGAQHRFAGAAPGGEHRARRRRQRQRAGHSGRRRGRQLHAADLDPDRRPLHHRGLGECTLAVRGLVGLGLEQLIPRRHQRDQRPLHGLGCRLSLHRHSGPREGELLAPLPRHRFRGAERADRSDRDLELGTGRDLQRSRLQARHPDGRLSAPERL